VTCRGLRHKLSTCGQSKIRELAGLDAEIQKIIIHKYNETISGIGGV